MKYYNTPMHNEISLDINEILPYKLKWEKSNMADLHKHE